MSPMQQFLLVHRRSTGLTDVRSFGDDERAAIDAYETAEIDHMDDDDCEVVLVGAESEESLRVTHASYFRLDSGRLDVGGLVIGL